MLDPVKTALAALGTAFTAGAAWVTLKNRVERGIADASNAAANLKRDLNAVGSSRIKPLEKAHDELAGEFREFRRQVDKRHEEAVEREARFRERLARLEQSAGIPPIGEPL